MRDLRGVAITAPPGRVRDGPYGRASATATLQNLSMLIGFRMYAWQPVAEFAGKC